MKELLQKDDTYFLFDTVCHVYMSHKTHCRGYSLVENCYFHSDVL